MANKTLIMVSDGTVTCDDRTQKVNMDELPTFIHAIRFENGEGEVEFARQGGVKSPNLQISSISNFQFVIDRWKEACFDEDAKAAEVDKKRREKSERAAEQKKAGLSAVQRKQQDNENEPS